MPYAEAIVFKHAAINLCPPGGVKTLRALGTLLQQDPAPFLAEMEQKTKPKTVAIIREAECIGCTKCIQACPVDAILGSAKQMHTVIGSECTGCELCVAPCPVDCIDLISHPIPLHTEETASHARSRYLDRQQRLATEKSEKNPQQNKTTDLKKRAYIEAALARAREKKQR